MTDWEPQIHALVTQRYPRLLARARMLVVSDAEAEDLVHDALIATFSKPRGFESLAQAEQYVRRAIVTSFANDAGRRIRERERWNSVASDPVAADPADGVNRTVDVAVLLRGLPPRVRACVALRYLEDLSIADTAAQLGLSEGAVKRYVSDGLKVLNAALGTSASIDDSARAAVSVRKEGLS